MRSVATLFTVQFVLYLILTVNYRAVARGDYAQTFVTDLLLGTFSFLSIRQAMKAEHRVEKISYVLSGALGAMFALWITRR